MLSAQFPETLDGYNALSNNQDMQLKVAKFLMAPGNMRDAMLSDFGWAWRQVKPLMDVFEKDVSIHLYLCDTVSYRLGSRIHDLALNPWLTTFRWISERRFRDMSRLPRKMTCGIRGNGLQCPRVCEIDSRHHSRTWTLERSNSSIV
jgi:hypothetical protein